MIEQYSNEADELVLGNGVSIGRGTRIAGGRIVIGDNCKIGNYTQIVVTGKLILGKDSKIGDSSVVKGREIDTGREFYTNHHAEIGGGSCFESSSKLVIGHWFHLGSYAMVNTAMPVEIGNEVGLGRMTNIYTHGAYLSEIDGFPVRFAPVKIGSRVWIPSATVNPGVTIGDDVVIGVGSVVTRDIPSGCLAVGIPCKVARQNAFPSPMAMEKVTQTVGDILRNGGIQFEQGSDPWKLTVDSADFDLKKRTIHGEAGKSTERARDLMRRHGIRFMADIADGRYVDW